METELPGLKPFRNSKWVRYAVALFYTLPEKKTQQRFLSCWARGMNAGEIIYKLPPVSSHKFFRSFSPDPSGISFIINFRLLSSVTTPFTFDIEIKYSPGQTTPTFHFKLCESASILFSLANLLAMGLVGLRVPASMRFVSRYFIVVEANQEIS